MNEQRDSEMLARFEHDTEVLDIVEQMLDLAAKRKNFRAKPAATSTGYRSRREQKSKAY